MDGAWVAHPIAHPTHAADAILSTPAHAQPLLDLSELHKNVLVAGCAPLLGVLAERLGIRCRDARLRWLVASSNRALDLLQDRLVHVAGIHLVDRETRSHNLAAVKARFAEPMVLVNLVGWRQGLLLPKGNPLGVRSPEDLAARDLRIAWREKGAGAHQLLAERTGTGPAAGAPLAADHTEVARAVAMGAADAGVAIEGEALAFDLTFMPLAEERFDLVLPARIAEDPRVRRILDALDRRDFRREVASMAGYDASATGHATLLPGGAT